MKLAVIGSRGLKNVTLTDYLPLDCTEIVSGGAKGIDSLSLYAHQPNGRLKHKSIKKLQPRERLKFFIYRLIIIRLPLCKCAFCYHLRNEARTRLQEL